jgi:hypothetical protein
MARREHTSGKFFLLRASKIEVCGVVVFQDLEDVTMAITFWTFRTVFASDGHNLVSLLLFPDLRIPVLVIFE